MKMEEKTRGNVQCYDQTCLNGWTKKQRQHPGLVMVRQDCRCLPHWCERRHSSCTQHSGKLCVVSYKTNLACSCMCSSRHTQVFTPDKGKLPMNILRHFVNSPTWTQPRCSSTNERLNKLCCICTVDSHSAKKETNHRCVQCRWCGWACRGIVPHEWSS